MNRDENRLLRLTIDALHLRVAGGPVQAIIGRMASTGPAAALPPAPGKTALHRWSIPQAAEWLRRHADVGGTCAAAWLEHPPRLTGIWLIILHRTWLDISAVDTAGRVTASATRYDGINTAADETCRPARRPGSATITLDGMPLVVRAPDMATAALGAGLAYAAASGRLPRLRLSAEHVARKVDLPAGPAELSLLVRTGYAGHPEAVAAAIEALRRLGPGRDRSLVEAMDGCVELRERVEELAGAEGSESRPGDR